MFAKLSLQSFLFSLCCLALGPVGFAETAAAQPLGCWHPQGHLWLSPLGDLNGSGTVNVADSMCAILVSLVNASAPQPGCLQTLAGRPAADVNCDGAANISDVQLIVRLSLSGTLAGAISVDATGCPVACAPCAPEGGGSCLIGATCIPEGDVSALQACEGCLPTHSASAWTALPDGTHCGAGLACEAGSCSLLAPHAPSITGVQVGVGILSVSVQPAGSGGVAANFTITAQPGGASATGASPLVLEGLDPGVAYTITAVATNAAGNSPPSDPWGPVLAGYPRSCLHILELNPDAASGQYTLHPSGGSPMQAWCDMTNGEGWILVAKIAAGAGSAFTFSSALWTTLGTLNPTDFNLSSGEAKYPAFDYTPFSHVRLVDPASGRAVIVRASGTSLSGVIASTPGPGLNPGGSGNGTVPANPAPNYLPVLRYDASSFSFLASHNPLSICNGNASSAPWASSHGIGFNSGGAYNSTGGTASGQSRLGAWSSGSNSHIWSQTSDCGFGIGVRSTGYGGTVHSGTTMGSFTTVWIRAAPGSSESLAGASCLDILLKGGSVGDGVYWIDPSGSDPFQAYCDMTSDGGGYTLYAKGDWLYGNVQVPTIADPDGANNRALEEARAEALVEGSTGLFRLSNAARTSSLFIQDPAPTYYTGASGGYALGHVWSTDASTVQCSTSYAHVAGGTMASTSTFQINCEPRGIGLHTCGIASGWILYHNSGTFNQNGQHPCPFGAGQSSGLIYRWVR